MKCLVMLTYKKFFKDPTNKIINNLKTLITKWKKQKYITENLYKRLRCNEDLLRAYDLPKVHKSDCPFRIIISSIGSPFYLIATFLHKIIISIPRSFSYSTNSFFLTLNQLINYLIQRLTERIQFFQISLFTNIPADRW